METFLTNTHHSESFSIKKHNLTGFKTLEHLEFITFLRNNKSNNQ